MRAEFDICELSLSSFTVKTAEGNCPYIAVPAFVSRAFRHTSIYVRTDRIKKPEDLKGRKVGVPEYQLTANVWARAFLEDDYGVKRSDIHWIRGGIEQPAGRKRSRSNCRPGCASTTRPRARPFRLCWSGRHRRLHRAAAAVAGREGHPHIGWLFPDPTAVAKDYFKRTGIFPIMHLIGIRRDACRKPPVAAGRRAQGLRAARRRPALAQLSDTSATKVTLPFVEERLKEARELMGDDFWAYGVAANRKALQAFLRHHHGEGLSSRLVAVDELFHPSTYETFKL